MKNAGNTLAYAPAAGAGGSSTAQRLRKRAALVEKVGD